MSTSTLTLPPFTVTRAAIDEIAARGGAMLLDLEEGGCCGTAYTFSLVEDMDAVPAGTLRYGCEGAWLLISLRAAAVLDGATIDHRARARPPRFAVLRNPNTPEVCPCRRSFGAAWPGRGQTGCRAYLPMPWDEAFEPPIAWQRQTGWRRR